MNRFFFLGIFFFGVFFANTLAAQDSQRYWIFFTDKGHYEQLSYQQQEEIVQQIVSERALDRRRRRAPLSLRKNTLWQDLPLEANYLREVEQRGFKIHVRSRWFNAISGYASKEVLQELTQLPFVRAVTPVRKWTFQPEEMQPVEPGQLKKPAQADDLDYGDADIQIRFHNIDQLHLKGLDGRGVVIAMFDTGFRLNHPALQHIVENGQLLGEYDFINQDTITANQPGDPKNQDSHGTITLSTIGGYLPGTIIGPAYRANFLLAKTEDISREVHLEEDNWAAAAEWASARGADIVSSSLGYSQFDAGEGDYSYQDMDGKTTIVTRAANFLAERGVLVVNSAGNEGNSAWFHIIAPADAPLALAVGALDINNQVTSFSSRGPTADGRIKPDVAALGHNVFSALPPDTYGFFAGTSLSCPLVAGISALILQAYPNLQLLDLLEVIKNSVDNTEHPDNERGWGKVDALKAWENARNRSTPPDDYQFAPPGPNPFTYQGFPLRFPVALPHAATIMIQIYNVLGQKVREITYPGQAAQNVLIWNGKSDSGQPLPSGIYLYRITVEQAQKTGRILILN